MHRVFGFVLQVKYSEVCVNIYRSHSCHCQILCVFERLQNGGALLNIDFKDCAVAVIPESVCFEMSFGEEEKKIGHGDLIPCFVVDR